MPTAARLALVAKRNEVARFTIAVAGIDLTGVAMTMQVRLGRGVPGSPLIQLATVTTTAAEGLKLDSVSVTNGVPTSVIKGRINASTMTDPVKLPYAGELGSDAVFAFAMAWTLGNDTQVRIEGDFIVEDSAYNSEAAPANRPPSYSTQVRAGGAQTGTLQFGDQIVAVSIASADLVGLEVAKAQLASAAAIAARDSALASVAGFVDLIDPASRAGGSFVAVDPAGFAVRLASSLGYQHSFGLADCDTIVHFVDSISAAHYVMTDKAWISVVSGFSPYRHINQAVSGNTVAAALGRVFRNDPDLGTTPLGAANARFAIIMGWVNDGDPEAWVTNMPKLVSLLRAFGTEPVFMTEAGQDDAFWPPQMNIVAELARREGADLIEAQSATRDLQLLQNSFLQSGVHPGTRTGVIYHAPVRKWLECAPRPNRSIKIYGARPGIAAGLPAMVFGTDEDIPRLFKEIGIGHVHYDDPAFTDEVNKRAVPDAGTFAMARMDQYAILQTGGTIQVPGDYTLLRVAVPGNAQSLDALAIELGTDADAAYVLDRFAADTTGAAAPMGAWTAVPLIQLDITRRLIRLDRAQLLRSMRANEVYVLLRKAGGVSIARPIVHHSGRVARPEPRLVRRTRGAGPEMLAKLDCATLAGWDKAGNPQVKVPFDLPFGAPRDPVDPTKAVSGVIEVSAADTIAQTVPLPASTDDDVVYRLRAWARFWPKPFLDNGLYGFPGAEVIDRSQAGAVPLVTPDTFDFRTLRLTCGFSRADKQPFASDRHDQLVGLYWSRVDFLVSAIRSVTGGTLSFRLSCPDGVIQLAKVSLKEVSEYVYRA